MQRIDDPDVHFMREAMREARRAADEGEVPVGAVLVHGGRVIARDRNRRECLNDPTAHAEVVAIRGAAERIESWRLLDTTLYVTLEPCAMCMGAIALARVERVVYGASDARLGACGSAVNLVDPSIAPHLKSVEGGVMADECSGILKEFFRALR